MFSDADFMTAWKVRGETTRITAGLTSITAMSFGTRLFLLKCATHTGKDFGAAMSGPWRT
jgi:hypothetical protein